MIESPPLRIAARNKPDRLRSVAADETERRKMRDPAGVAVEEGVLVVTCPWPSVLSVRYRYRWDGHLSNCRFCGTLFRRGDGHVASDGRTARSKPQSFSTRAS